jgi:hypothetical protein
MILSDEFEEREGGDKEVDERRRGRSPSTRFESE